MYNTPTSVVAAGSVGALAFTGSNVIWFVLAGFAMIAAGTALARIVPRRER
jgi:LPXTG-motif cell wall-anchored protein